MMKSAFLLAGLLSVAPWALAGDQLKFREIERAGFSIELLQMPVVSDEGLDGFGKFKMAPADSSAAAEITWEGGFEGDVDELKAVAGNLFNGTMIESEIESSRETATWDQVSTAGHIHNQVFIHMIMRHCKATGLLLTVGNIARDKHQAEAMHQRSLKSLRCKPGSPADFVGRQPPSATLPADFAYHKRDAFEFLANQEGDMVLAEGGASDTLRLSMKRPELLATVYGNALGESLGDATAIEMATGLGGIEQHRFSAFNSARHEFRFAVLFCTADQQQYLLVAFNTERKRKRPALDQLLDQVGCPSEAPGSYRSRPDACDQGIQALCD